MQSVPSKIFDKFYTQRKYTKWKPKHWESGQQMQYGVKSVEEFDQKCIQKVMIGITGLVSKYI